MFSPSSYFIHNCFSLELSLRNKKMEKMEEKITKRKKGLNLASYTGSIAEVENKPGIQNLTKFEESRLSVSVSELFDLKEKEIIEEECTYLAIKNPTSFLIGTDWHGIKVIEERQEVYSARFGDIEDVIYINHLNCYLIYGGPFIY